MTRSRTAERKKAREKQQRRQRIITAVVVVSVVVVLAVVLFVIANQPAEAPIPAETATRYEDVRQGRTQQGFPVLGEPDARIQVAEYGYFGCIPCAVFHEQAIDELVDYARNGDVAYTFIPIFVQANNSRGAARAAVCAAEQDKFWALHDAMFEWPSIFGDTQAFTNSRINAGVNALGLNTGQYTSCVGGGNPDQVLLEAANRFNGLSDSDGDVPTITINGVVPVESGGGPVIRDAGAILDLIEEQLAALEVEPTAEPTEAVTPEATAAATEAADDDESDAEEPEATTAAIDDDEPEATAAVTEAATDEPEATEAADD
jgi:hypothetical protein